MGAPSSPSRAKKQLSAAKQGARLGPVPESDVATLDAAARTLVVGAGQSAAVDHMWVTATHRPSAAEVKAQLQNLQRRQQPSTLEQATAKMRKALVKVDEAGRKWQESPTAPLPSQTHDYKAMVEDGQGSAEWRAKLAQGALVPQPFLTGGRVGANPGFSLSAVREFLVLKNQGVALAHPVSPPDDSAAGAPTAGWLPRSNAVLEEEVVDFVDSLCPEGADRDDPPNWVCALLDGDLLEAKGFWR